MYQRRDLFALTLSQNRRSMPPSSSIIDWDPGFLGRSPMFEPLRAHAPRVFPPRWPDLSELQQLLDGRDPPVRVASGAALRVVPQARKRGAFEEGYEARVYLRGELQVRSRNWHDLFNVLAWLAFPGAKAALNARHYEVLRSGGAARSANRGPVQDALTLFDEGGVIVATCDGELEALLRAHEWKELFWRRRAGLDARMRFHLFGHALYEKALRPFAGVTGRGIVLRTDPGLLALPIGPQLADLDARVAAHIGEPRNIAGTRELAPIPILGVPGWSAENEREAYYDDTDYFRPKKP